MVRLQRWDERDRALLAALNGDPAQMTHLGGPESEEQITERHARYAGDPFQFVIVDEGSGAGVGWVGFWPREHHGATVFEMGWSVLPAHQGRGIAAAAVALAVGRARAAGGAPAVHAFPAVANAASNAVCRRAGFTLVDAAVAFEYPPGHELVCNDWRLALSPR